MPRWIDWCDMLVSAAVGRCEIVLTSQKHNDPLLVSLQCGTMLHTRLLQVGLLMQAKIETETRVLATQGYIMISIACFCGWMYDIVVKGSSLLVLQVTLGPSRSHFVVIFSLTLAMKAGSDSCNASIRARSLMSRSSPSSPTNCSAISSQRCGKNRFKVAS